MKDNTLLTLFLLVALAFTAGGYTSPREASAYTDIGPLVSEIRGIRQTLSRIERKIR